MPSYEQGIQLPNAALTLTRSNGNAPDVAPSDAARMFYSKTLGALMLSVNGGAYQELQGSGAAGDTLTIGADVTLQRSAANVLFIPETVQIENGNAALSALRVRFHASQTGNGFAVQNSDGTTTYVVIDASGNLGVGRSSSLTNRLEVLGTGTDITSGSLRCANTNNGSNTAARAGVTMESATSSGFIAAFPSNSGTTAFIDNFVISLNSDATAMVLNAGSGSQEIRFRVPTTGQILSMGTALITIADGVDLGINATTGTKIGQSGSKISAYGNTPVVRPAAYTQTYATATRTHANPTATALTDNTAGSANTTLEALTSGTVYSSDVAAIRNNFADLAAAVNAVIVDLANNKQISNQVIDDLQLEGWLQ